MEEDNISMYSKSDNFYLGTIGEFVRSNRIAQDKTQEALAQDAGINRSTVVKLEKGKSINLLSLIQILRVLKRLDILSEMEIKPQVSPLKYAAMQIKSRQRASGNVGKGLRVVNEPKSDW